MDAMDIPLMEGPTVRSGRCVVCGARRPLEQHHVVRRGAGRLFRGGVEVPKPTLTLCGAGNVLSLGGRPLCHGLAHHHMLHFRFEGGRWEYLRTDGPVKYARALSMEGWAPLPHYARS